MALSATCLWGDLDDVKPWVTLQPGRDVLHDVLLTHWAESVTQQIERETGRIFVSRTITGERLSGQGRPSLELQCYPVSAITSLTEDGAAVEAPGYWLKSEAGILTKLNGLTWSALDVGNIVCTYTAGYARASVPSSVITLAAQLLRAHYLQWTTNGDVFQSIQLGPTTVTPMSDWIGIRKQIEAIAREVRVAGLRVA